MRINPVQTINFRSKTLYEDNMVTEQDVLSLEEKKSILTNPVMPSSKFLGVHLSRLDSQTINIVSAAGNKTGEIKYSPNKLQPQINLLTGKFQPVIELYDPELGIKVLLTRKSKLNGANLNIDYKERSTKNLSFGHRLVVTTGYQSELSKKTVNDYFNCKVHECRKTANLPLKYDYTIVALGEGNGSRLRPISDSYYLYDGRYRNKVSTTYPNNAASLVEISALRPAALLGVRKPDLSFVSNNSNISLGTAGIIIKGLRSAQIPTNKPLVVMTSDTFHNIDLNMALYEHEKFGNSGVTIVAAKVPRAKMLNKAPIGVNAHGEVLKLYDNINKENYASILNNLKSVDDEYYVSTGILILSPEVLELMRSYGNKNGYADLTDFIGFTYNLLVNKSENIEEKYNIKNNHPYLPIYKYTHAGKPRDIVDADGNVLKMHVVQAKDQLNNKPVIFDAGSVEGYVDAVRYVAENEQIDGVDERFTYTVKDSVENSGIIYINPESKQLLELFKSKYGIDSIEGNVVVVSRQEAKTSKTINDFAHNKDILDLYAKTSDTGSAISYVKEILKSDPGNKMRELVADYGLGEFLNWYMSPDGYLGAYEKYIKELYQNCDSVECLLKVSPNWAPWMLEKKAWDIDHSEYKNADVSLKNKLYNQSLGDGFEYKFSLGSTESAKILQNEFSGLIYDIKTRLPERHTYNFANSTVNIKRLKGGELNDKFVYLLDNGEDKFILKLDRINAEDAYSINNRVFSRYEKKAVRKNKHLMPDSLYLDACMSKYLELNGCKCIPKLYYYDYRENAALYEYVQGKSEDLFQKGELNDEQESLICQRELYKELSTLGIYINDRSLRNILKDYDDKEKLIDLGHADFIMPFKPAVKDYQIELPNACGADIRGIFASIFASLSNNI